jgi:hypothetical protein
VGTYKVNIATLPEWAGKLVGMRKSAVISAIRRTVYVAGQQIVQQEIDATKPYKPVDRGDYRRGWRYTELPDGARLHNGTVQAAVIERGRRPGTMPPISALARWAARKFGADDQKAMGIAWAIGLKQMLLGTPGMFVLKRTMKRLVPIVNKNVDRAMGGG